MPKSGSFLKGSLILLISFNIFNVLNFLYNFAMARILSVAEYGALASIMALLILISMPSDAIQNTITKYVNLNNSPGKIKNILRKSLRKAFLLSLMVFALYAVVAIPLSGYLNIGYFALATGGLMIFASMLSPVTRGALLGEKKFNALGWNMIVEGVLKIVLGVLLVLFFTSIGWSIFRLHGALLGAVAGALFAFLLTFVSLKKIFFTREEKADVRHIYGYARPAFFVTLAIFAFIGLDILVARAVFDPDTAGAYAIASVLAKIIFYGTIPVSRAMFPLSSEQANQKKNPRKILFYSSFMVLGLTVIAMVVLWLFPQALIYLFSGKDIPMAKNILFYLGLATSLLSLANLFLIYRLSLGKIRRPYLLMAFVILEVGLLFYFSQTILSFSLAFLSAAIIFLIGSIIIALYG
ncbi:MAG: oligosaccharide flippase family protein [Nanoarchaeota archaeon]|nr:oligosaccharide flippase family protein [Nanoarchaeota archaeon]MBU0977103.1 oligosaccharide flippase family protein [Nanoarchaeota archaeon]